MSALPTAGREAGPKLEIDGVGKRYGGGIWGLRGASLELGTGVLGLLGSNGAGKSTLMRILGTVMRASTGHVRWNDVDVLRHPDELRKVLGYLPQEFGVYPHLNAVEFLGYIAALKGVDRRQARQRIDEMLHVFNLEQVRRRPLGGYSGGMRQRIGIAQALLNDPRLLIMDEPTTGLDPEERMHFRNLIGELAEDRVIILSTHIVSDVEAAATDIAIIQGGVLLVHSPPRSLLHSMRGRVWELIVPGGEVDRMRQQYTISGTVRREDGVHLRVISDHPPSPSAGQAEPNLEDVYLYWTNVVPQRRAMLQALMSASTERTGPPQA